MTSKGIAEREKRVHSSLLSWALANDNNLSSYLFLDNEIKSPFWPDGPLQAICNILFDIFFIELINENSATTLATIVL